MIWAQRLLLIFLIRLPFFMLTLAALAACSFVIWVYNHTPADWLEEEDV
jgi:hypothetical protein